MKKVLFVNKSFELGGIQSSLNNLINVMCDDICIDLLIFNDYGVYRDCVPDGINVIKPCAFIEAIGMSLKQALRSKRIGIIVFRIFATLWSRIFSNAFPIWLAFLFQKKLTGYDCAIAYHHEAGNKTTLSGFSRFVLNKTEAKCKVAYIHTDIKKTHLDTVQNRKTYSKLDKIIAVSDGVKDVFIAAYPELENKTIVIPNFHQFDKIISNSQVDTVSYSNDAVNFLTVARISEEKGQMRVLNLLERLKAEGYKFYWHIVGGASKEVECEFKKLIENKNLKNNVFMYGLQKNPYRFFVNADALLVPSYNEAAPMVFSESECLKLPIIATRTSSTEQFVTNKKIGLVCENNDEDLYNTLKLVLDNPAILDDLKSNFSESMGNDESKNKFLALLND